MKPKIKIRKKKGWRGGDNAKEKSLQTIVKMLIEACRIGTH
jgi:hypothetical protein